MASDALEEKINKIRLQNEEIRRRYEEVEADKKNAAQQNALVQLVPSEDWPERKEPPEFSAPSRNIPKQKMMSKEQNERLSQHYASVQERIEKKGHKFAPGDGPPPDPKYNFLADSERESSMIQDSQTMDEKNKERNKAQRGGLRRRGGGEGRGGGRGGGSRDAFFKDNRGPHAFHGRDEFQPDYEAWRAERNRIDEARINRQKTAEGNWRREWDCNKVNVEREAPRKNEFPRKETNNYERRSNHFDNDHANRPLVGGNRMYQGPQKSFGNQEYRRSHQEQTSEYKRQPEISSPSIAGTGRVGPRQKSRVTYSSQQSEPGTMTHEIHTFTRQQSFDEKTVAANLSNGPKITGKNPFPQRKKEGNSPKSPYLAKKEFLNNESFPRQKRNEFKDQRQSNNYIPIPQRTQKQVQNLENNRENVSLASYETENLHNDFLKSDEGIHTKMIYNPEYSLNEIQGVNDNMTAIEVDTNEILMNNENNYDTTIPDDNGSVQSTQNYGIDETIQNTQISHEMQANNDIDRKDESQTVSEEVMEKILEQATTVDANEQELEKVQSEYISSNLVSKVAEKIEEIDNVLLNEEKSTNAENVSNDVVTNVDAELLKLEYIKEIENSMPGENRTSEIDIPKNKNTDDSGFGDDSTLNISLEQEKSDDAESKEAFVDSVNQSNSADLKENIEIPSEQEKSANTESKDPQMESIDASNPESYSKEHVANVEITAEQEKSEATEAKDLQVESINVSNQAENSKEQLANVEIPPVPEKTEVAESENPQVESIKASNPSDDTKEHSDNVDTASTKSNLESNENNSQELEKSESADATKEKREEKIESCDNISAASNETSEAINDKDEEMILENSTKDNDVRTIVDTSSDESLKMGDKQKPDEEKETSTKEVSTTDIPSSN